MKLNGLTMAYVLAFANSTLGMAAAFGAHLSASQQTALIACVNSALILVSHLVSRTKTPPTPPAA